MTPNVKAISLVCLGLLAAPDVLRAGGAQAVHTLEPVEVTGERLEEYVRNHPQNVVSVGRAEIEERGFLSTAEALGSLPGVDVSQRGPGLGTRIRIRGVRDTAGVLVLVNGRPLNATQYGGVNLHTIPIETVERITVYKPPVPAWLGPGATAGAVNIVTRDAREARSGAGNARLRVKARAGSYGVWGADGSVTAPGAGGSVLAAAGWGHRDGKRPNSDRDAGSGSLHWSAGEPGGTRYNLDLRLYHARQGAPGPTDNPTPDARQHYDKGSVDLRLEALAGEIGEVSLKAFADGVRLEDRPQTAEAATLETWKAGLKEETLWSPPDGAWALRAGGLYQHHQVVHTLTGVHHRDEVSLHGQLDRDLGRVTASLGGRADYASDFGWFPGLTGGVSWSAGPRTSLKLNAGHAVGFPTFGQLYQPSHGSLDQVRGNPDLDPERTASADLTLEHRPGRDRSVSASVFASRTADKIGYRRGADLVYRPENLSAARRHGVEVAVKERVGPAAVDLSYVWVVTRNDDTGGELAYAPRHTLRLTAKGVLPPGTRLEATLRAASPQYSEVENRDDTRIAGYATVDVQAVQPFTVGGRPVELLLRVRNLFDAGFEFHHGYPDDGFRALVEVSATL